MIWASISSKMRKPARTATTAPRTRRKPSIRQTRMAMAMVLQDPPFPKRRRKQSTGRTIPYACTRAEERRVGTECDRSCRYRWAPAHQDKEKQSQTQNAKENQE